MYEPSLSEYMHLFRRIFDEGILKYRYVTVTASVCAVSVFISTYYFTKIAEASSVLFDKKSVLSFSSRLYDLFKYSLLAILLKHLPLAFFTFIIQFISRNKFLENLRDYMNQPYTAFHTKTPGEIRFNIFLKSLSYPMCPQILIFDFVGLFGTILFTFIKAYTDISILAAITFLLFPMVYGIVIVVFLKYRLIYHTNNLEEQQKTSASVFDRLSNYDVIKTYNLETDQTKSFKEGLKPQVNTQLKLDLFIAKSKFAIRLVTLLPYILFGLFFFFYPSIMNGNTLFQAVLLYSSLSVQIKKLGAQLGKLVTLLNQIRFDSIDTLQLHNELSEKRSFDRNIRFENVNLYHNSTVIIQNINLEINKGEKVVVVGENGTGKSTFIKSLFRFTKTSGSIYIDDLDIKTLSNKSVFNLIAYIPQNDFTSDDTVINNLRLGKEGCADEVIYEKAMKMKAHDTFLNLPDGYNTHAGIKGNKLSGGQKQKLSLVRAAVKDAPIFVLDEATAAIDKGYERTVMDILLEQMKGKTVIAILHNKEYLKKFDKIIYLEKGRVGSVGTYSELLESHAGFADFVRSPTDPIKI